MSARKQPRLEIEEEECSDDSGDDKPISDLVADAAFAEPDEADEVIARGNNYDLTDTMDLLNGPLPPPLAPVPLNVVDPSKPPMGTVDDLVRTDAPGFANRTTQRKCGRYVCFTSFKFDQVSPTPVPFLPDIMNYLVYQKERAPNTGHLHLQGYVQLKQQTTWKKLKELLCDSSAHVANSAGSPEQNKVYCTKIASRVPGTVPWEYGVMQRPGKRNDLDDVVEAIKAGSSEKDICQNHTAVAIRYHAGISYAMTKLSKRRDPMFDPVIYVDCGCPRSGKSYQSRLDLQAKYPRDMVYEMSCNNKGFLYGYMNQKGVMIDEFRGNLTLQFFKSLIHAGDFNVATFGAHMPFMAEEIHICSNYSPELWYKEFTRINDSSLSLWGVLKQVRVWTAPFDRATKTQTFRLFQRDPMTDCDGRQLRDAVTAYWQEVGLSVQNPYDDEHRFITK